MSGDMLSITMPVDYMNIRILGGWLVADTNDSANWDEMRFPLPDGDWTLHRQDGKTVTLIDKGPNQ